MAEAIQSDLLDRGYSLDRLGTPSFSWWDLKCILRWLPEQSAVSRLKNPDHKWDLHAHLQAITIDILAGANWQRSGDKNAARPNPFPRPGVGDNTRKRPAAPKIPLDDIRTRITQRQLAVAERQQLAITGG